MHGETVIVKHIKEDAGYDDYGNPIPSVTYEPVQNVLVAPGQLADVEEDTRPYGILIKYNLYFPKSYKTDFSDAVAVIVRSNSKEDELSIIGHPDRYADNLCPTKWNMVVSVGGSDG